MLAYHNDPAIKQKYLDRVAAHAAADNLIQGTGWKGGKGCAVGCTLENYDHSRYPIELGLPEWLAHLEDRIFEGLPKEDAMSWPERFLMSIPVGSNVEPVRHKLAIRRLDRLTAQQIELAAKGPYGADVDSAIQQTLSALAAVRSCHEAEIGGTVRHMSESAWSAAESAAWSAESAAESAYKQEAADLLELLAACEVP